jgi:hypothetical protein
MKNVLIFGCVVLVALAGLTTATSVAGPGATPGVLPPQSHAFGKTYDEWAAAWWQWSLSIPKDVNPMLDTTGANAALGQDGHVWFLAGIWGGNGTYVRTCNVPAGKALFFPIYNNIWVTTPGDYLPMGYDDPVDYWADNEEWVRNYIGGLNAAVKILSIEIDGVPVPDPGYRVSSPAFAVTFPEDPVWDGIFDWGVEAGVPAWPTIDEGSCYLMLAPLSVGEHTIHFETWVSTDKVYDQDVTYHLTVGPAKKK